MLCRHLSWRRWYCLAVISGIALALMSATKAHAGPAYPSISGSVFVDYNKNGKKDLGEWAIGGARIVLRPKAYPYDSSKWLTVLTKADGSYYFDLRKTSKRPWLGAGNYTVGMLYQPKGFKDGVDLRGKVVNAAGVPVDAKGKPFKGNTTKAWGTPTKNTVSYDMVYSINIPANGRGINYNFAEYSPNPKKYAPSLSKRLFLSSSSNAPAPVVWVQPYAMPAPPVVPEPGTFALLAVGAIGLAGTAWFRRRKARS